MTVHRLLGGTSILGMALVLQRFRPSRAPMRLWVARVTLPTRGASPAAWIRRAAAECKPASASVGYARGSDREEVPGSQLCDGGALVHIPLALVRKAWCAWRAGAPTPLASVPPALQSRSIILARSPTPGSRIWFGSTCAVHQSHWQCISSRLRQRRVASDRTSGPTSFDGPSKGHRGKAQSHRLGYSDNDGGMPR